MSGQDEGCAPRLGSALRGAGAESFEEAQEEMGWLCPRAEGEGCPAEQKASSLPPRLHPGALEIRS